MKIVNDMIVTPMLFIYPEFGQFDYVGESSEDIKIWDIFEQIFQSGLPWDQKQHYTKKEDLRYFVMVYKFFKIFSRKMEQNLWANFQKIGRKEKELLKSKEMRLSLVQ